MPRILPRLITLPLSTVFPSPRRQPRYPSKRKPIPPLPSALAADYPRSVLLSPGNIITNSHDYVHYKSTPPVHRLHRRRTPYGREKQREMTAQERTWWSSPYLRMLASPIRRCFTTEHYLPMGFVLSFVLCWLLTVFSLSQDFLVRLAPMRVPRQFGASWMLFPDGIQHPHFKPRKSGRGLYIGCYRETLAIALNRGKYKRFGAAPPRLTEHITHLLRLRVLQELQLLASRLTTLYRARTGPASARPPLIRRLTRAEWGALRETGIVPQPDALAVLVVPPVNRDPVTKKRAVTADAMSDRPSVAVAEDPIPLPVETDSNSQPSVESDSDSPPFTRPTPPVSVLHPTRPPSEHRFTSLPGEDEEQPHAPARVPLYNGVALFPGRGQRARVHGLLTRLLGVEAAWRFSAGATDREAKDSAGDDRKPAARKGDNKGSHAFLICASDELDVGALCIALWRVRMWEGGGWRLRSEDDEYKEEWPWAEERR
ncbi:hypothetical protein C8R43DRAFT_1117196 [Mycena crocata]|nr:hypothetical protein C8R43DRAFT_1117196 [Mycena crocata]